MRVGSLGSTTQIVKIQDPQSRSSLPKCSRLFLGGAIHIVGQSNQSRDASPNEAPARPGHGDPETWLDTPSPICSGMFFQKCSPSAELPRRVAGKRRKRHSRTFQQQKATTGTSVSTERDPNEARESLANSSSQLSSSDCSYTRRRSSNDDTQDSRGCVAI